MEGHPRQIVLSELKIHSLYLEDALAAILHTILFVRAPSIIKAKDQACQHLAPLVFATCGTKEIDQSIELDSLLWCLIQFFSLISSFCLSFVDQVYKC